MLIRIDESNLNCYDLQSPLIRISNVRKKKVLCYKVGVLINLMEQIRGTSSNN